MVSYLRKKRQNSFIWSQKLEKDRVCRSTKFQGTFIEHLFFTHLLEQSVYSDSKYVIKKKLLRLLQLVLLLFAETLQKIEI